MSETGFILDIYPGTRQGRTVTYATGRLANGETFGLVDERRQPTLYVRASAVASLREHLLVPTALTTMDGEPVLAITAATELGLKHLEQALRLNGVRTYEGDTDFATGYLMAHDLRGGVKLSGVWRPSDQVGRLYINPEVEPTAAEPQLRVLSFDLETDVQTGRILAASLVAYGLGAASEEVLVLGERRADDPPWLTAYAEERQLLNAFASRVRILDPDIITGWNIIDFDLPTLAERFAHHGLPWALGRTRQVPPINKGRRVPPIRGRQVLDALRLARSSSLRFDDYKLGTVAQAVLGRGKLIAAGEYEDQPAKILAAYRDDRTAFAAYCLEDAKLVRDLLAKEMLLELAVSRTRLIGLPLEKNFGSIASFDFIYMGELRKRGHVAPSRGVDQTRTGDAPGGLVLEPHPGLYQHIFVFDFRSLYPSIIRTFNIDPLARAKAAAQAGDDDLVAPNGVRFARPRGILPEMLDRFFQSRAEAVAGGHKVASYAYKIIMNSFYGVLGTDSCRFAASELAGAITGFGHLLLRWMREHFTAQGFRVLYGDTDSLFVDARLTYEVGQDPALALARGASLAAAANAALAQYLRVEYGVESRLALQFEKYYRAFLLPSSRGGGGRAKSYAGQKTWVGGESLDIVGMEAVRSDWTLLARTLQRDLLAILFNGGDGTALHEHIRTVVAEVSAGTKDGALIYRKRIRKPLSSYTATTPPQIKAARLLPMPVKTVRYVMTVKGPQPLEYVTAPLDYAHYVAKQILPIAEMLAEVVGFDAASACRLGGPRSLFGD